MVRKENSMEMVPRRNELIEWEDNDGFVVLSLKRQGVIDRFMNRLFKSPDVIKVDLEEIGSYIWKQCDGINTVHEISIKLQDHFGEKIEPVIPRLVKYLKMLAQNNFIKLK